MSDDLYFGRGIGKQIEDGSIESVRDDQGFTSPNLHRRIDSQPTSGDYELAPRQYYIAVQNTHSISTIDIILHEEDSVTSEFP